MNDVQAKTIFAAKGQQQADRSQLRLIRPRLQVGGVAAPIGVGQGGGRPINRACELRVNQQRKPRAGNVRQRHSQLLLRNHGEAIDSGIDQKTLETRHTCGGQRFDITLIIVNHAAPGRPINAAFAPAAARLACSAATVVVAGRQFSGISTSIV